MTWNSWWCLEDGRSVSQARKRITYGNIAGLPVPSPELPDHVIRCSRWPEQRDVPSDALQSPSQGAHSGSCSRAQACAYGLSQRQIIWRASEGAIEIIVEGGRSASAMHGQFNIVLGNRKIKHLFKLFKL